MTTQKSRDRPRTLILLGLLADILILAGVGLISYGAWLILPAAGFITAGLLLISTGVLICRWQSGGERR